MRLLGPSLPSAPLPPWVLDSYAPIAVANGSRSSPLSSLGGAKLSSHAKMMSPLALI
jgi:hypothetical protein